MSLLKNFDGLIWLAAGLLVLIFLQRSLHREIQATFLIMTRKPNATEVIFAVIFFPGVLLHESSHYLMAKLMGVRTGRFSLIPQAQPNGKLRLGYVEMASGGFIRDALIGFAPLLAGSLFVAYVGIFQMHLLPLWDLMRAADWSQFLAMLSAVPRFAFFWLWFYLAFTISSTMMPSTSDRQAWLPLGFLMAGLVGVAILAGAGTWMLAHLAPPFNQFLRGLAMIFALSGILHGVLILPFLLVHVLMAKVSGVDIR